jgi:Dolichyl-phosphate-mannose-protein mannosyltransferase
MNTPVPLAAPEPNSANRYTSASALVLYLAGVKLLFHLLIATRYGIFRDEMYYLACSEHLAWGYVDHPPMTVFIAWFARHLFGDSLIAVRLLPALAGAALVWLTGNIAKEMGGGRFARAIAALAVLPVPFYLLLHHWLTNNAFEPLVWMSCIWCVLRAINTGNDRYLLWFGVLAGIGFETKYSIAFLLAGILAGVLFTPQRRVLRSKNLWLGMAACALIALPNLLWQVRSHFPFLELMHNVRMSGRDVARGPTAFIVDQAANMNPILFPLWLGGLIWLFVAPATRCYRIMGWTYVVTLGLFIALKGKNYYVAPIYPMLFAAGAVALDRVTSCRRRLRWARFVYPALCFLSGLLLAPLACPILPPETFLAYQRKLGIKPPAAEHQNNGPLPQQFADEFGWEPMVQQVARVFHSLPPEEQARTAIFSNGWGEAAAVDYFGPKYGLPKAVSRHNNYWLWGARNYSGEIVIVLRSNGRGDREHFQSVQDMGAVEHSYSRRDEWFHIFLCRGLKADLRQVWPQIKLYD